MCRISACGYMKQSGTAQDYDIFRLYCPNKDSRYGRLFYFVRKGDNSQDKARNNLYLED